MIPRPLSTTRRDSGDLCESEPIPFQRSISVGVHGLRPGLYSVTVNGVSDHFEIFADPGDRELFRERHEY